MTVSDIRTLMSRFAQPLWNSTRDLLPIVGTVGVFQLFVFQQPLENVGQMLTGLVLVIAGLTLFVVGLEVGLFPVGAQLAQDFAKKGSVPWLIAFAFALGFGTTFAEPALIAVAGKAAELAVVDASSEQHETLRQSYAFTLRITVALAVGFALVAGVLRIVLGWPLHFFIMGGYILVMLMTPFAPTTIIGVAYDSGGVTTSTITVPLTTALGVGLASSIKGRSPLLDGFGLIAFASLTPIIFVLLMGILWS
jgi:MFS family permease